MEFSTHQILVLLGSTLTGGVALSLIVAAFKKFGWVRDLAHALVVATSAIAAAAQYVIQYHSSLPTAFLGVSAVSIYGFSQLVYKGSKATNGFLSKVYAGSTSATTPSATVSTPAAAPETTVAPSTESDAAGASADVFAG